MKSRYNYRFYPTDQQAKSLAQLFGCVRVVWNDALNLCKHVAKLPSNASLQKIYITLAKQTPERAWLSEVSNIPLQQSIIDLGTAYSNYFDSLKGKRKGVKVGQPRFKKKTTAQSARFRKGGFVLKGQSVYLAKIGNLKPIWSRELPSEPSSVTVIKDSANRYFLSFVVETEPVQMPAQFPSVGIDLGLKTFAVLSTGEKVERPDYKPLERKISRLQRKAARGVKGSNRRNGVLHEIAKLNARLRDTRKDFLHKLSTRMVRDNQSTVLEDLNVAGMVKNRKLSRAISRQGWAEFRTLCQSKAVKFARSVVIISRWEPTSQICSGCGYKWGKLDLKVRTVVCLGCSAIHCRDGNAARNIENVGLGHSHDAKWAGRGHQTISVAILDELSTQLEDGQLNLFAC